jgi:hypothetical protein
MNKRPTVEQFLSKHPPETRAVVEKLRTLMRATIPVHIEAVYPGWGLIGYRVISDRKSKYFAYIAPGAGGVKLGFEFGVLLPDPAKILKGNGKQVRFIFISKQRDIKKRIIGPLIWEAAMVAVHHTQKKVKK